jgi:hypothetical protein
MRTTKHSKRWPQRRRGSHLQARDPLAHKESPVSDRSELSRAGPRAGAQRPPLLTRKWEPIQVTAQSPLRWQNRPPVAPRPGDITDANPPVLGTHPDIERRSKRCWCCRLMTPASSVPMPLLAAARCQPQSEWSESVEATPASVAKATAVGIPVPGALPFLLNQKRRGCRDRSDR